MASFFKSMFSFSKSDVIQYIYLIPEEGSNKAQWEIFDQDELERRLQKNLLVENGRLFGVNQEYNIRFEIIDSFGIARETAN